MSSTEEQEKKEPRSVPERSTPERSTLVVTNLIKLGGLAVALHEVFFQSQIRSGGIALAALMMAGAQSLETFLKSFFGGQKS